MILALLCGILIGLTLALTGAGGGILAVPALTSSLHMSMQQAAPVALMAVSGAATVGALRGLRQGIVRYRAALFIALMGIPFTLIGHIVAAQMQQRSLVTLFAIVMVIVAYRMWTRNTASTHVNNAACILNPGTGRLIWTAKTFLVIGIIGALTGTTTGLLGVGGGFIVVPALKRYTNLPMHSVVATSLMVIALVGFGSVLTSLLHTPTLPWIQSAGFCASVLMGMFAGQLIAHRINAMLTQKMFALVLVLVSTLLLVKAWAPA